MRNIKRRKLIATVPLVLPTTGCTTSPFQGGEEGSDNSDTPSSDTSDTPSLKTPGNNCEAVALPWPTPTKDSLEPRKYPEFPDNVTRPAVKSYARQFNKSYIFNEFIIQHGGSGYDEISIDIGVPDFAVKSTNNGYIVGVRSEIRFDDTTTPTPPETGAPTGFSESNAWFYITSRFVLRKSAEDFEKGVEPEKEQLKDASIVACAE